MTDFDALLKRSFAEAPEPTDDGFVVNVAHSVAKREAELKVRGYMQLGAITISAAAVSWGIYTLATAFGPGVVAAVDMETLRASAAIDAASDDGWTVRNVLQSMGVGLTQILLLAGVLAGGAVAYRASQD